MKVEKLTQENEFDWRKKTVKGVKDAYDVIDVLILYLSIANNPNLPDNLRDFFNELVETYLERNHTSLEDIYKNHFE